MDHFQNPEHVKTLLLEPRTGAAVKIQKGQVVRVIDVKGQQVVDLVSYSQANPAEYLSSGRTIDYTGKIFFSSGDVLYSDQSKSMWTILNDTVGRHCFLFAPCDQKMFELTYGVTEPHPNCYDNLSSALARHGIKPSQIIIPLNLFMNIRILATGEIEIQPPLSQPGDYVDLRAEDDLILGISACSAYKSNNYTFSQVRVEIYSGDA
jgi:uncharacterized protein YcgI (DUF1989 family)